MSKAPAEERLMNLCAFLLSRRDPATLREIINSVEGYDSEKDHHTNRRMFLRDKKELSSLSIEINTEMTHDPAGGHAVEGYIIDPEHFYLPRIQFTPGEALALKRLRRRIADTGGSPFKHLDWALMKLAPGDGDGQDAPPPEPMLIQLEQPGAHDTGLAGKLIDATAARRTVTIAYRSAGSKKKTRRDVDPYGLFVRGGFWYLYGYCHLRKGPRTFRLDRLELAREPRTAAEPDYSIPDGFSLEEQVSRSAPWDFGDEETTVAVVQFHPDVFWRVRNAWGGLASARADEENCIMELRSVNDGALARWLLGFGENARVIAPAELHEMMKTSLEEIAANAQKLG